MRFWQRFCILILSLVLVGCSGTVGTAINPDPPAVQGDITIAPSGETFQVQVRFPKVIAARSAPADPSDTSSIPFGTTQLLIRAQSQTPAIPYEVDVTATREQPSVVFRAVPRLATILFTVEAQQVSEGIQVLASGSVTLPPGPTNAVALSLTAANFVPVLQGINPNPTPSGSLVTLQGLNLNNVTQVLFTTAGTASPVLAIPVVSSQVTVTIPATAISGPVIALNDQGVGVGVVNLTLGGVIPSITYYFSGPVGLVGSSLQVPQGGRFVTGQTVSGQYTFSPSTTARSGSTSSTAVFDALTNLDFKVNAVNGIYQAVSGAPQEIQVDNAPGATNDRYAVLSRASDGLSGAVVNTLPLTSFSFRLDDTSNAVFSDALTLPTSLNLASFNNEQFFIDFGGGQQVSGPLTSLSTTPPVLPIISSFPSTGSAGTAITITGSNFTGATAVLFNGIADPSFTVDSATQITATVPPTATTGLITVSSPSGFGSSASPFTVSTPPPTITGTPASASVGTPITITGTNFVPGGTTVTFFSNVTATPTSITPTQITVPVPNGATTGVIRVTTSGGSVDTASPFTVLPTITGISVTAGSGSGTTAAIGDTVTITGTNLGLLTPSGPTPPFPVSFNGVAATNFTATYSSITAEVPVGATSGVVSVTTLDGQTATSPVPLTVYQVTPLVIGLTPVDIAARDSSSVIVSQAGGALSSYSPPGASVVNLGTSPVRIAGIFKDATSIFFTQVPSNRIAKIPVGGGTLTPVTTAGLNLPRGITFDPINSIFVVTDGNTGSGRLARINSSTGVVLNTVNVPGLAAGDIDYFDDGSTQAYVFTDFNGRVLKATTAAIPAVSLVTNGSTFGGIQPLGVFVLNNTIYFTDLNSTGRLFQVNLDGTGLKLLARGLGTRPAGLALDPTTTNTFLVADAGSTDIVNNGTIANDGRIVKVEIR